MPKKKPSGLRKRRNRGNGQDSAAGGSGQGASSGGGSGKAVAGTVAGPPPRHVAEEDVAEPDDVVLYSDDGADDGADDGGDGDVGVRAPAPGDGDDDSDDALPDRLHGSDSDNDTSDDSPDPPQPGISDTEDDTLLFVSAVLGFLFFMVFGAILPKLGIDQSHVMAGGMIALMVVVVLSSFCPQRCTRALLPCFHGNDIPPPLVFLVAGCLGTMIGGMFGGVLKNVM